MTLTSYGRFYRALFLDAHLNREGSPVRLLDGFHKRTPTTPPPPHPFCFFLQIPSVLFYRPTIPGYLDGIDQIVGNEDEPAVADDDPWLAAEMYDYKTKTFHLDRREGPKEGPATGEECVTRVIDSLHSLLHSLL